MDINKIEQLFTMANNMSFFPSENIDKNPSVVGLEFHDNLLSDAILCYSNLKNKTQFRDLVLSIRRNGKSLNAAIISKSNEEVMSFNVVSEKGLDKFINETDKNHPFVFVILKKSESLPNIVADSDEFSPIVFDKYIVSQ